MKKSIAVTHNQRIQSHIYQCIVFMITVMERKICRKLWKNTIKMQKSGMVSLSICNHNGAKNVMMTILLFLSAIVIGLCKMACNIFTIPVSLPQDDC